MGGSSHLPSHLLYIDKEIAMSLRRQIIDTIFKGRENVLKDIITRAGTDVSPNGVVTAPLGTFLIMDYNGNAVDDDVYINTNGTTGWSLIYDASALGHLYA